MRRTIEPGCHDFLFTYFFFFCSCLFSFCIVLGFFALKLSICFALSLECTKNMSMKYPTFRENPCMFKYSISFFFFLGISIFVPFLLSKIPLQRFYGVEKCLWTCIKRVEMRRNKRKGDGIAYDSFVWRIRLYTWILNSFIFTNTNKRCG